jgi:hypothetical protein
VTSRPVQQKLSVNLFVLSPASPVQSKSNNYGRITLKGAIHSVKLSDFTVWRDTWRKNWVNCAILTRNNTGLRTALSSRLSHRELRSSLRETHSFLSLPADTTMAHAQEDTQNSQKKTDKPDGKLLLCQRTFSSVFRAVFFIQITAHFILVFIGHFIFPQLIIHIHPLRAPTPHVKSVSAITFFAPGIHLQVMTKTFLSGPVISKCCLHLNLTLKPVNCLVSVLSNYRLCIKCMACNW